MVTLVVMVILTMLAAPNFIDYLDRTRLRGAVDDVVSQIGNARAESVKTDRDVNISFQGSGDAWCVGMNAAMEPLNGAAAGTASTCDCDNGVATQCQVGGERRVLEVGAHPGVSIGTLPPDFIFDSKLGLTASLGTTSVTLTSPRGKYDMTVQVNPLGQARACTPPGKPVIVGVDPC